MRIISRTEINRVLSLGDMIPLMREALIAQTDGQCDTPMPMHIHIADHSAELHLKSSYRVGGSHFVVKIAGNFPQNASCDLPTGSGMMLLLSSVSGEPIALLSDGGDLTDARTAAVAAMMSRELGRTDHSLGVLGTGIQARWQVRAHAAVLPLREIWIWGRNDTRAEQCRAEIAALVDGADVRIAKSAKDLAGRTRLIVTTTSAREPLIRLEDVAAGTLISAVGSDSPGKQELDPRILERASLILVDSKAQCERLGELQHSVDMSCPVIEMGKFCKSRPPFDPQGTIVADFTGLGIEDLFAAEDCFRKVVGPLAKSPAVARE